ncbi:hypothetical protein Tco_0234056, partial [Tanacetum coccineum]
MPELHNKMELLRERTGPLLRQQGPCLQIHFYLTLFGLKQLVLLAIYIRPFGCHVTILNTIYHLGKFARKSDEGFLVGYSLQSKAFRVYNLVTKRVDSEENQANLHAGQQESKQNSGTKDKINSGNSQIEDETDQDCFEQSIWHSYSSTNKSSSRLD